MAQWRAIGMRHVKCLNTRAEAIGVVQYRRLLAGSFRAGGLADSATPGAANPRQEFLDLGFTQDWTAAAGRGTKNAYSGIFSRSWANGS